MHGKEYGKQLSIYTFHVPQIHILVELFPYALNLKVFCPQASRDVPKALIGNRKGTENEKGIDSKER